MTPLVVISTRMSLMLRCVLMRTRALWMIGARLRAAPVFWPTTFVLWLRNPVSMCFLARCRALHVTGRILLMRHWAVLDTTIVRIARARGYDFPAVKFSGPRGGRNRRSPMVLGSQEGPIAASSMLMLHLHVC